MQEAFDKSTWMFGSVFAVGLCDAIQAVSRLSPGKIRVLKQQTCSAQVQTATPGLACGSWTDLLLITSNIGCANLLFQSNLNTIVLAVPLPERSGINLDDSVLDKSLGSDLQG